MLFFGGFILVPLAKATRKLDAVDGGVGVCAGVGKRGTLTQHAEHAAARGAVGAIGACL